MNVLEQDAYLLKVNLLLEQRAVTCPNIELVVNLQL